MRHLKCSLCLLALPTESLGYTVLTGLKARVWLALSSKKKLPSVSPKINLFFPKNFTPYWAPKDVKSFSIKEEFFGRVKEVLLSWVSVQMCKKSSEHNYSTQTTPGTYRPVIFNTWKIWSSGTNSHKRNLNGFRLRIYCLTTYQKSPKILAWKHVEKLGFVGAVDRCIFHCMETRLIISRPNA